MVAGKWWRHKLRYQVEALESGGHKMAYSRFIRWYPDDGGGYAHSQAQFDDAAPAHISGEAVITGWTYADLLLDCIVWTSTVIVEKTEIERAGLFDRDLRKGQDYDLWLRLARRYPFVCTSDVTACYRVHPNQASRNVTEMVLGRWRVKHHFWSVAKKRESPAFVEQLEAQMRRAFAYGLQTAWDERNEAHLRAALAVHKLVPNSTKISKYWRRRYRLAWPFWVAMGDAWDRMLPSVRRTIRPLLSPLFGPTSERSPLPDYLPPSDDVLE